MKFLVDARLLQQLGYDAIHTLDLPEQNRTSDETVNQVAVDEGRIVITKDSDFVNSFLLVRRPPRLLLVSTGNISNRELERLFLDNIETLITGFATHAYIELSRYHVIIHR